VREKKPSSLFEIILGRFRSLEAGYVKSPFGKAEGKTRL
jgi:hypothetical protein